MKPLTLGYSPCPNDTFIFYGMTHGCVETAVEFAPPYHKDVETLNKWALEGKLDVTKLSFHALGHVLDEYWVLPAGSALGRGCGPLLVADGPLDLSRPDLTIAIPGRYTTAALLFQMFAPQCKNLVEVPFEKIMDSVVQKKVDAGVIIHEGRFTYQSLGLSCIQDLGEWWEKSSGEPIPLGCICAKRNLGEPVLRAINEAITKSLYYARDNQVECLPYIRQHSQELDDQVVQQHIDLYVNDYSTDLGLKGKQAVVAFLEKAREREILPMSSLPIVFDG